MNPRSLIQSMGGKTFPVRRYSAGAYVNGMWQETLTLSSVFGSAQPLTGLEIVRIPEGDRERERLKIYSADELRASKSGVGRADEVVIEGDIFQVERVERWANYWKAFVVKREDEPEEPEEPENGEGEDD